MRVKRGLGQGLLAGLSVVAMAGVGVLQVASAAAASAMITISDPGAVSAGPVQLRGTVGVGPAEVTSVLFAVDATDSTASPAGNDCTGDGLVDGRDDVNADGVVGDTLDCEIAAVVALNSSLAEAAGTVQVGLLAFANQAAAADLSSSEPVTFVPPGFIGGNSQARVVTAARSVTRNQIGQFRIKDLGGSGAGTAFDSAVKVSLDTLAAAPAGPKWVMFLSDGLAPLDEKLLPALNQSGVKWRSFALGGDATCHPDWALADLSAATGESCVSVGNPASLAAGLVGSQPDSVNGVTVSVGDVAVAAELDAVGGWRAPFMMGAGTYTAVARTSLRSGATMQTSRTLTVSPALPGVSAPPPGSVALPAGAKQATEVHVRRPRPTRAVLPSTVAGRVGRPGATVQAAPRLAGATVVLQARRRLGDSWVKVGKARVSSTGAFTLRWDRRPGPRYLRVALRPFNGFAGSAAAVPRPPISACHLQRANSRFTVACLTTAPDGHRVRMLKDGRIVDRTRVSDGTVTITAPGRPGGYILVIDLSRTRHLRLPL